MGNLNTSENNLLCCCRNENTPVPRDYVDVKVFDNESCDLTKKINQLPNSVKFELDSSERKRSLDELKLKSQIFPIRKHQNTNSIVSVFNSTEFSLNEEPFNTVSVRLDQISFLNKVKFIQRMFRKRRTPNLRSESRALSSMSQFMSDSRLSINNHSLFLKHVVENSKQPELYTDSKEKKSYVNNRTPTSNATGFFLQSNPVSIQNPDRRNLQSLNELSSRKNGAFPSHSTCKLYKQKGKSTTLKELKSWLRNNANIYVKEECLFGIKLYNNGSKIVGFFDLNNNVDGVAHYESQNFISYKGNVFF